MRIRDIRIRTARAALWMAAIMTVSAAIAQEPPKPKGKVLVILSSKSSLSLRDGKSYSTGYFFNEVVVPVRMLVDRGYQVVFANPAGNAPTMDKRSDSAAFFYNDETVHESYRRFAAGLKGLQKPEKLAAVIKEGLDQYAAVFIPGGHAPLEDLSQDADAGRVLRHFHESGKPTAAICHGPIAFLSTLKDPAAFIRALEKGDSAEASKLGAGWPYAGYGMTVFSTPEEQIAEQGQLGGKVRYYAAEALKSAGGEVNQNKPGISSVTMSRELITGQNPDSDVSLAEELVKLLEAKPKGP